MAADFALVDPVGWELDLHSVYSAYMGHFQLHNIAWYDRSWASLFISFDTFLSFGWPAVIVTDARTGRPHIVTRLKRRSFCKDGQDEVEFLKITGGTAAPSRTISDAGSYKKIFSTLPAAALAARRTRLWHARESLWLALSFDLSERTGNINAWGYSVLRAPLLEASGAWPPNPADNYRKGYYVVQEALERRSIQTSPRDVLRVGKANVVSKSKLPDIVGAIISSLAGPESESQPNPLIIVTHGEIGALAELKIKLPNNTFIVDVGVLEKNMYAAGMRGNNASRSNSSTLSLTAILRSLDADLSARGAPYGVAGNDALATLLALQMLMGDAPATIPTPARPRFSKHFRPRTSNRYAPLVGPWRANWLTTAAAAAAAASPRHACRAARRRLRIDVAAELLRSSSTATAQRQIHPIRSDAKATGRNAG
ncbi:hypothetical protein BKA62DRAFT_822538 [Auriculariales sp. MPI-PUGE-AT-0066]|nr:hypothetical protein BKA62DRAFT_822538 [Auriculariales sp. MPI-PUGE-AT-0066]